MTTTIATHDGTFHLDELIAIAALEYIHAPITIVRTRDPRAIAAADIAVDVGGGAFDHHQPGGNGIRPNGIPYASAGLVWQAYGVTICGDPEIARRVDERFIQSVDAADAGIDLLGPPAHPSGVRPITLQTVITWCNPVNGAPEDYDRAFFEALPMARAILGRAIETARQSVEADRVIADAIARWDAGGRPPIMVFDRWAPGCVQAAAGTSALYALFPDIRNGWRVQAVPETPTSRTSRLLLPEAWRGMQANELAEVSGVHDAVFCHQAGFIAGARSFYGALRMALAAVEQPEPLLMQWPDMFERAWMLSGWNVCVDDGVRVVRLRLDGIWFTFREEIRNDHRGSYLRFVPEDTQPTERDDPTFLQPMRVRGVVDLDPDHEIVRFEYQGIAVVEIGTNWEDEDHPQVVIRFDAETLNR